MIEQLRKELKDMSVEYQQLKNRLGQLEMDMIKKQGVIEHYESQPEPK